MTNPPDNAEMDKKTMAVYGKPFRECSIAELNAMRLIKEAEQSVLAEYGSLYSEYLNQRADSDPEFAARHGLGELSD